MTSVKAHFERLVEREEDSVREEVRRLRRHLDAVEVAVENGHRVPSSVSGGPFVDSAQLVQAILARQFAYDVVALLDRGET